MFHASIHILNVTETVLFILIVYVQTFMDSMDYYHYSMFPKESKYHVKYSNETYLGYLVLSFARKIKKKRILIEVLKLKIA